VRERGASVQGDVLNGHEKFPERLGHVGIFAPRRNQKVNRENHEVRRHDPQDTARVKSAEIQTLIARELGEELAANQVAAENEEKVDTNPTPAVDATRQRKTHDAGVINDHDDDRERAEKIETRLALAILKARVEISLKPGRWFAFHTKRSSKNHRGGRTGSIGEASKVIRDLFWNLSTNFQFSASRDCLIGRNGAVAAVRYRQ